MKKAITLKWSERASVWERERGRQSAHLYNKISIGHVKSIRNWFSREENLTLLYLFIFIFIVPFRLSHVSHEARYSCLDTGAGRKPIRCAISGLLLFRQFVKRRRNIDWTKAHVVSGIVSPVHHSVCRKRFVIRYYVYSRFDVVNCLKNIVHACKYTHDFDTHSKRQTVAGWLTGWKARERPWLKIW